MTGQDAESDRLDLDVGRVWRDERVSCPHPDILRAFDAQGLEEGAMEFLRFHLERSQCPYCNAVLESLRTGDEAASAKAFADVRDRLLRSTRTAMGRAGGAG